MFKSWQYHVVRAVGKFICLFSYDTVVAWGRKLGPVIGRLMKKQRDRGIRHVMRGMACDEKAANDIIDGVFANLKKRKKTPSISLKRLWQIYKIH